MAEAKLEKVKRSLLAHFLNVDPKSGTESYKRMGKGITSQVVAMNPTVSSEQYINEDSATASVDAYAPTIETPMTAYKNEPVFEFVLGLYRNRAIGDDCMTDLLEVHLFDKDASGNTYYAQKNKVAVSIQQFGGDAGNPTSITYSLNYVGDAITGKATVTDGSVSFTDD